MALEFAGPATPIDDRAISAAAEAIGCPAAAVRAVIDVESRGGFLPDRRPRILFERHYFSRLTARRHDADHPGISQARPGGYLGGASEYQRLHRAIALDRDAALRSASWGAFQIMGDNCTRCGFAFVEDFVAAMVSGEPAQLSAFVAFLGATGLDQALVARNWSAFARGYNGPGYRANRYDQKLAEAYRRHASGAHSDNRDRPVLRRGSRGEAVRRIQRLLAIPADGIFGLQTQHAVLAWQREHGLLADGVVGRISWATLTENER